MYINLAIARYDSARRKLGLSIPLAYKADSKLPEHFILTNEDTNQKWAHLVLSRMFFVITFSRSTLSRFCIALLLNLEVFIKIMKSKIIACAKKQKNLQNWDRY